MGCTMLGGCIHTWSLFSSGSLTGWLLWIYSFRHLASTSAFPPASASSFALYQYWCKRKYRELIWNYSLCLRFCHHKHSIKVYGDIGWNNNLFRRFCVWFFSWEFNVKLEPRTSWSMGSLLQPLHRTATSHYYILKDSSELLRHVSLEEMSKKDGLSLWNSTQS